ncbi:MAG: hypothetical protein V3W14_06295 [Candidatus Neomarinimicrobiota bacterium]
MSSEPFDPQAAMSAGAMVFETMHPITLHSVHNEIRFYTWSENRSSLPTGATKATLLDQLYDEWTATEAPGVQELKPKLKSLTVGEVLVFEELLSATGHEAPDPNHRHFVRLTVVRRGIDPLTSTVTNIVEIEWAPEDALPFPLELGYREIDGMPRPLSVARGNVVLADHGVTTQGDHLKPDQVPGTGVYRPRLIEHDLTHSCPYNHQRAQREPAGYALTQDSRQALPAVLLAANGQKWLPQRDLLSSARDAQEFVVETEDEGDTRLRFGDNVLGRRPTGRTLFSVTSRRGNGEHGNIGADTLLHIDLSKHDDFAPGDITVRNPLPASGGVSGETQDQVKLYAPQVFSRQERAVTPEDYAIMAQRHPEVQKAVATLRWTGSWHTVFLLVDRKGGYQVDSDFEDELRSFLERYRLARHDLEIEGPHFIPLDIILDVKVLPGYFPNEVKRSLLQAFVRTTDVTTERGFFHPDNFTFGQPLYLSEIVALAMGITGVDWVNPKVFKPWGQPQNNELEEGILEAGRLEIFRLDNDPNAPHNGRIDFQMLACE